MSSAEETEAKDIEAENQGGGLTGLVDAAFNRAKVAMLALVVMAMLGISSYINAPRESDPDIPLPFVQIILPLPGVSPEDAERLLIRPTETELQSLEGLVQMDSNAFDGAGEIRLEFEPTLDMDQAVLDVREAVDRAKAEYPLEAKEPIVEELNAQQLFPVVTVVLSGDVPERALFKAAKSLEDQLAALPGVLEVNLAGARDEVAEIIISPEAMENYGVTPNEIAAAIQRNNALVTAGNMRFADGSYAVKVPGLFKSLTDIETIPLRADAQNLITLGDVADVRRTFEDADGYARFNGEAAIGLNIAKRTGANLINVTEVVRAEALRMAESWPSTIEVAFVGDQSTLVASVFSSLTASISLAIILVMIVVVAALGLRSAVLVGIAIPSSFLIGLFLIGVFGFTLNMMIMFSMVLSVGMLVDGAIVIVELADRRMSEGVPRREAFMGASKRMFWPITASTATTLAAFVPFLFWDSVDGEFMKWIPITLILILTSSLFVALIFLPIIGASFAIPEGLKKRFNLKGQGEGRERIDLDNTDPTTLDGPTGSYARFIQKLVEHPVKVTLFALFAVVMCQKIFAGSGTEVEYFIRNDSEQVLVLVQGRGNMSEQDILQVSMEVQERIQDHPAIEYIYLQTGPAISRDRNATAESIAQINLDLIPYQDREHSSVVLEELRDRTASVPGVVVEVRQPEQGPQIGKDVQVELTAADFTQAMEGARLVREFMEQSTVAVAGLDVPTFMDIEDNQPLPGIEWEMVVDRAEAGRYGLTVSDVGSAIQLVTEGLIVGTYRPDDSDEELDIRLRYPADARSIEQLSLINITTPLGNVPLTNFTVRQPQQQVSNIMRRDARRIMDIKANANTQTAGHEVSQDLATKVINDWLETGVLAEQVGSGVQWKLRGAAEDRDAASSFFQAAMTAAMFMIGVILLLQFNNFYHSLLTLSAVILSVFGVLLGIALSGQYISVIMTGVGIVALAGIVVNNNIVLIDTFHNLRKTGLDIRDAVVRTAAQRLRPVLLTTITTIIGLLPMGFEIDIDFAAATIGIGNETSDWWVLLSSAIVYGLAFSTLLTLVLTPVLLAAPAVISERMKSNIDWVKQRFFPKEQPSPAANMPEEETPYSAAAE
ncbi:MAG: efflux RND transporter permease subunit [Pseudomonadota bacterium]